MVRSFLALVFVPALVLQVSASSSLDTTPSARVDAILTAVRATEGNTLWPGFEVAQVPVAVFDGRRTFLFRHPAPPSEFAPVTGRQDLWVMDGQHPAVRANTSAEIGGRLTATCLAESSLAAPALAAIVVHEAFHVYQRQTHPEWVTNEMHLFTYPTEDARNLAAARLEALALERALNAADSKTSACWAKAALATRLERFARLPEDAAAYERGVELVEGTASLVQYRTGDRSQASISGTGFGADKTRLRAYAAGRTIGLLLDRFAPGWDRRAQAATGSPVLHDELFAALSATPAGGCGFTREEAAAETRAAESEVAAFLAKRAATEKGFLDAPGWRVVVRAPEGKRFGPQGFDPMNVLRLGEGQVLHQRWLKTGGSGGVVEVMNRPVLTKAAGAHPLFNGFRELVVTGLASEPAVSVTGGAANLQAEGLRVEFPNAVVARTERTIVVSVEGAK